MNLYESIKEAVPNHLLYQKHGHHLSVTSHQCTGIAGKLHGYTCRYPLNGGMQDFNYIFTNDMEITLELSCCKFPKRYYLNKEWERNQESLLSYLEQVHRGVRGLVKDSAGDPVREAIIFVTEEGLGALRKNVTTSFRGEFWRLLMPGEYTVTAELSACDTAGIVMSSLPVKVSLTEDQRLVDHQLVLDQITPCSEGPR